MNNKKENGIIWQSALAVVYSQTVRDYDEEPGGQKMNRSVFLKKSIRKWTALSLIVIILSCLTPVWADSIFECRYSVTFGQSDARAMLKLINDFRTGSEAWYWNSDNKTKTVLTDLSPLTYDYQLEKDAMQRAAEIALYYSHTRPDGTGWDTVGSLTYGENIAAGYPITYINVFGMWQESSADYEHQGHRRNMLGRNYATVGIGHVTAGGCEFWVQEFGLRNSGAGKTAVVDTEKEMTVQINEAILSGKSITGFASRTLNLDYETRMELPLLNVTVSRDDSWSYITDIKVKPEKWTSSDTEAVSVEEGTATGFIVGKTKLTATLWNSQYSVTANVVYNGLQADMVLPKQLKQVDQNVFERINITAVDIPEGVTLISSGAFKNCLNLKQVRICGENTEIDDDAFPSGQAICFICPRGSKAQIYAEKNHYKIVQVK